MNTVKILVHKELATTFNSWSIYIGYTLFFCVCGFFSWLSSNNLLYIGQANMMQVFGIINWTQFFLIPALTKPIKTADLLCSKFFSNLIITTLALALTLPYYITLSFLGEVDHGAVLLGYLGLIEMRACYICIGIFSSSLSRTAVSAFFISLGIGLCFQFLFGMFAEQIGTGIFADLFSYLSMEEHFDSLSRGILDSRDIIYFGSVITVFLALSKFFICKSRF